MLRRVKSEVETQLGQKQEVMVRAPLSALQTRLYKGLQQKLGFSVLFGGSSSDKDGDRLLNMLMQFRKVVNHPHLFQAASATVPVCLFRPSYGTWDPLPLGYGIGPRRVGLGSGSGLEGEGEGLETKVGLDITDADREREEEETEPEGKRETTDRHSTQTGRRARRLAHHLVPRQGALSVCMPALVRDTSVAQGYDRDSLLTCRLGGLWVPSTSPAYMGAVASLLGLSVSEMLSLALISLSLPSSAPPSHPLTSLASPSCVSHPLEYLMAHDHRVETEASTVQWLVGEMGGDECTVSTSPTPLHNGYIRGTLPSLCLSSRHSLASSLSAPLLRDVDPLLCLVNQTGTGARCVSCVSPAAVGPPPCIQPPLPSAWQSGLTHMASRLVAPPYLSSSPFRRVSPGVPPPHTLLMHPGSVSMLTAPRPGQMIADAGKLGALDRLLFRLRGEGHRVLIYSQMTKMLDVLEQYLTFRRYSFIRFDGSYSIDKRRDLVDTYMTDPSVFVFLLSTRAGGLGINLTAADTVIFYDSDWNPTVDAQAMDRCHRLGQTRPVTVYRLVTPHTVDERILYKAQQKARVQRIVMAAQQTDARGRRIAPEVEPEKETQRDELLSLLFEGGEELEAVRREMGARKRQRRRERERERGRVRGVVSAGATPRGRRAKAPKPSQLSQLARGGRSEAASEASPP
ncbi:hypothetical protein KIPB_004143 [Kipferlia bialata]|uniref:Chromatin-remodeling ATPase INO80 n=1 Tax=Kipferlia bialata TaxID=797122 RepID=A0A9K3GHJ5_9EUKA|nr:hypothetical protein KIPB_004143 [Kipferlia bialata]|eukprot:g4143.t1